MHVESSPELVPPVSSISANPLEGLLADLRNPHARVRQLASEGLVKLGEPAVEVLAAELNSKNHNVRESAVRTLKEIGSERALDVLRETLIREIGEARRRKNQWIKKKIVRALLVLTIFGFVEWLLGRRHAGGIPQPVFQFIVQIFVFSSFADAAVQVRRDAAEALANSNDVRMAGVLALCLREKDKNIHKIAVEALLRLLPRLQASDANYVSFDAMVALLKEIENGDRKFVLVIVRALEQIGDETALPIIERIVRRDYYGWDSEIYRAAKEVLPVLQQRAEQAELAHTLLRASTAPTEPETVLLRPAASSESRSGQLLRPASKE